MNSNDLYLTKEIRPLKALSNKNFDQWVTSMSPKWQRKHIVMIRRYQKYECNDGGSMNTSNELWRGIQAFTFTDKYFDRKKGTYREWLIGSACFKRYEYGVRLDFCWLHPFWRNKGLLKKTWPQFIERFGNFYLSRPISREPLKNLSLFRKSHFTKEYCQKFRKQTHYFSSFRL